MPHFRLGTRDGDGGARPLERGSPALPSYALCHAHDVDQMEASVADLLSDESPRGFWQGASPPTATLSRPVRWSVQLAAALLLAAFAGLELTERGRTALARFGSEGAEVKVQHTSSSMENNTEYHTSQAIYRIELVPSAELCRTACQEDERCGAWNWGAKADIVGLSNVCSLRSRGHNERPKRMVRPGIIAGLPLRRQPTPAPTPAPRPRRGRRRHAGRSTAGGKNATNKAKVDKPVQRKTSGIKSGETCPGRINIEGHGKVSLVAAEWNLPVERAATVEVLEDDWVLPYLKGRAYFASRCSPGAYRHQDYLAFELLGKTLRYTVDLSNVGCRCAASLYLVPMRTNPMASQCSDFYCDAGSSCGVPCDQITIQQANQHTWSSNIHLGSDPTGVSTSSDADSATIPGNGTGGGNGTARGNETEQGRLEPSGPRYGPGASCIDTSLPFEVSASFPKDREGRLLALEVTLSQSGRDCPVLLHLDHYTWSGQDGLHRLSRVLSAGVTPVVSYAGAVDMPWMVGAGLERADRCGADGPEECPDSVRFYDFSIQDIGGEASGKRRRPPPSSLIGSMIERAIEDMRSGPAALEMDLARELQNNNTINASGQGDSGREDDSPLESVVLQDECSMKTGSSEWEVIFHHSMNVRREKDMFSAIVGSKPKGTIIAGQREGDWVKLVHEPGYMRILQKDVRFMMERRAVYRKISTGSCTDVGLFPIVDVGICENAAFALGYYDTSIDRYDGDEPRPYGCYLLAGYLFLGLHPANHNRGVVGHRQPICSSEPYPEPATTTSTTTQVTTTAPEVATTTTLEAATTTLTSTAAKLSARSAGCGRQLSLFCMSVLGDIEQDAELVKAQLTRHAGIFACEEHAVFAEGEQVLLGLGDDSRPKYTQLIPPAEHSSRRLASGSSSRTELFMRVWDAVDSGDLFRKCDYTVKVEPDTVFFPSRLRAKLSEQPCDDGRGRYLLNCEEPRALLGSLEVLSKHATEVYLRKKHLCLDQLQWKDLAEDQFLSQCLNQLEVGHIDGSSLLSDRRCKESPCTDTSKAALGGFKDRMSWVQCWGQSVLR